MQRDWWRAFCGGLRDSWRFCWGRGFSPSTTQTRRFPASMLRPFSVCHPRLRLLFMACFMPPSRSDSGGWRVGSYSFGCGGVSIVTGGLTLQPKMPTLSCETTTAGHSVVGGPLTCSGSQSFIGGCASARRSPMGLHLWIPTNPEGWKIVAGGRSGAETPGSGLMECMYPEGMPELCAPSGVGRRSWDRGPGGVAPLDPRLADPIGTRTRHGSPRPNSSVAPIGCHWSGAAHSGRA